MNGKERLAGAVLILTLAIGIVAQVFDRRQEGYTVPLPSCDSTVASEDDGHWGFRKLDLNSATAGELEILPGIGPKKAQAIVEYRKRNGCFTDLDHLDEVKGIGKKTLERIAPYVSVIAEGSPACE